MHAFGFVGLSCFFVMDSVVEVGAPIAYEPVVRVRTVCGALGSVMRCF